MTLRSEQSERLQALFDEARALDGAARAAFLNGLEGTDRELRDEVCELLSFLDDGHSDGLSDDDLTTTRRTLDSFVEGSAGWLPDQIGGYRISKRLGEGGMGVVYEALQESPRRKVAIKLLHPHLTTEDRLRRFRQEAELLGRLQHPSIARIFEAGTFDLGRGEQPFFAMELIEGVEIRLFAERQGLDERGKLALLAQVADGVQHAHDRDVIHRDLKPENVLVDDHGRPVVLDFGVARTRHPSDVLSTLKTEEGVLLGTLAYMAPEQLSGSSDAISPRTDVYALGVLAFELLSGRLPHELGGLPFPAALRVLSDEPSRSLSDYVPASRGDVETIVSKAMAREPERRYASAEAFAADIRRCLDDRPILARPTSRIYRVRKYARRHPSLVAGTLVMTIAAIVSTFFAQTAARERDNVQSTTNHLRNVVEELAQPFPIATRFLIEGDDGRRTLVQGERLTQGDRVVLEVQSLLDLNLYIFNQDDTGLVRQIFPVEGLVPQNPLPPNERFELPGRLGVAAVSWTVNSAGGTERFLLLALPPEDRFDRQEWELDRWIAAPPSAVRDPGDVRGMDVEARDGVRTTEPLGTHSLAAFDLLRAKTEELGRGWVRVVQFESVAQSE